MALHMIIHPADSSGVMERRRRELGYSRERLGAAAGGISAATVRRAERGLVTPHPATCTALARALDCEVTDLFPLRRLK